MIIGLLSDTHSNLKRTARAVAALKSLRVEQVIHCGDIGSSLVLTELAAGFSDPDIPVTCVLGNVDGWDDDLYSPVNHVQIAGRFAAMELAGRKIAVLHGDDAGRLNACTRSGEYDYIFTGHTHVRADEHYGKTRVINPGAIHRSPEPGCAVLDLKTGRLRFLDIAD